MKSNFKSIIDSETPVLVDFYADWCGPCKTLAPILKQVKDELQDAIKIVKIDVDKNQSLASPFRAPSALDRWSGIEGCCLLLHVQVYRPTDRQTYRPIAQLTK